MFSIPSPRKTNSAQNESLSKGKKYKRHKLKRRFYELARRQFKGTTIHGLPYSIDEKLHPFERIFWVISFLSCLILAFYLLSRQFSRFIKSPTVMSVEMDYFNWNVSYPAFTLCPDTNFKIDIDKYQAFVNETRIFVKEKTDFYVWSIATAGMDSLELLEFRDLSLIDPRNYSTLAAALTKPFDPTSLTTNNNWPISVELVMTELGMCHVLNSNVAAFDNPYKWTNTTTRYSKNNIELSVYDQEFFTQIMNSVEIYKVFIHSPDETILATTSSYSQSKRGFISLGVQVWSTRISDVLRSSPIEFRKCRFVNEPINKRYPIYSYSHCLLECRIRMIIKLCGCVPHFYRPLEHERVCYLKELECVKQYKREIISLSATEETRHRFRNAKDLPKHSSDCKCISQCEFDVYQKDYENFLPHHSMNRLRVGISQFPKIRVVRNIIFNFDDIVLKVGGVLNLCVGTSVLSFMEFLIPIIKIIIYAVLTTSRSISIT